LSASTCAASGRGIATPKTLLAASRFQVIVEAAKPMRENAGPNEHAFVEQFNQFVVDNPIPVE